MLSAAVAAAMDKSASKIIKEGWITKKQGEGLPGRFAFRFVGRPQSFFFFSSSFFSRGCFSLVFHTNTHAHTK